MKIWGARKHVFFFFTTPRIVNFVSSHVISSFHHLLFMTWTWINNIIYIYIILYLRIYIYLHSVLTCYTYLHAIHTCTHTYTRTCIDMQNMQSSARWEEHGEHEQQWGYDFGNWTPVDGEVSNRGVWYQNVVMLLTENIVRKQPLEYQNQGHIYIYMYIDL